MRRTALLCLVLCLLATPAPARAAAPIPVAAIYAVTGPAAPQNAPSLLGLRLAVEEINRRGGVLGRPLELKVLDNRSTPIGSKLAAEEAARLGAAAILGSNWSSHSLAVAQVAQAQGVPMISDISTNPRVTKAGDFIFRVCFTDDLVGQAMARFARTELAAANAAVFVDTGEDYSLDLAAEFTRQFTALGGAIAGEIHYKFKQSDFAQAAARARDSNATVCFLSGHDESGSIAAALRRAGAPCIPLGGDGWGAGNFMALGGSDIELGYYCSHWDPNLDTQASRTFVNKYGSLGPLSPTTALAYDAAMLLADAMARAGSVERHAIRNALAQTRDFEGVTGALSFERNGDPRKRMVIMEVRQGQARFLKALEPR